MSDYTLGEHSAKIEELQRQVSALDMKVDGLVEFVNKIDGAWKLGAGVLTAVGAVIGVVMSALVDYVKARIHA